MSTTGKVDFFDDEKGFGFITPDGDGDDCFVHHSDITGSGYKSLDEGDRVEFEVISTEKGPRAENVVKL